MLTHGSLLKLEFNYQSHLKLGFGLKFVLTTWSRRTVAKALILEQPFCYCLWGRATTNILDLHIHTSNYAAKEEFLDTQQLPPWKWARFGGFKHVLLPCRPEELSPPSHDLAQSEADVVASPVAEKFLKAPEPHFEN